MFADDSGLRRGFIDLYQKQLPFGTALGLTRTAQKAREAVQRSMASEFGIRNKSLKGAIARQDARKQDFPRAFARVGIRADEVFDASFLADHVTGGVRRPKGHRHLVIPVRGVKRTASGKLRKADRPSEVLSKKTGFKEDGLIQRRKGKRAKDRRQIVHLLREKATYRKRWDYSEIAAKEVARRYATEMSRAFSVAVKTRKNVPGFRQQFGRNSGFNR